jgi:hypothetical protein
MEVYTIGKTSEIPFKLWAYNNKTQRPQRAHKAREDFINLCALRASLEVFVV